MIYIPVCVCVCVCVSLCIRKCIIDVSGYTLSHTHSFRLCKSSSFCKCALHLPLDRRRQLNQFIPELFMRKFHKRAINFNTKSKNQNNNLIQIIIVSEWSIIYHKQHLVMLWMIITMKKVIMMMMMMMIAIRVTVLLWPSVLLAESGNLCLHEVWSPTVPPHLASVTTQSPSGLLVWINAGTRTDTTGHGLRQG